MKHAARLIDQMAAQQVHRVLSASPDAVTAASALLRLAAAQSVTAEPVLQTRLPVSIEKTVKGCLESVHNALEMEKINVKLAVN